MHQNHSCLNNFTIYIIETFPFHWEIYMKFEMFHRLPHRTLTIISHHDQILHIFSFVHTSHSFRITSKWNFLNSILCHNMKFVARHLNGIVREYVWEALQFIDLFCRFNCGADKGCYIELIYRIRCSTVHRPMEVRTSITK